jgi:hypothetical protein
VNTDVSDAPTVPAPLAAVPAVSESATNTSNVINVSEDMQRKIIERARHLVVRILFTQDAMSSSKDRRRVFVANAIANATLELVGASGKFVQALGLGTR